MGRSAGSPNVIIRAVRMGDGQRASEGKVARPAGIEPAAPRLGVQTKEATRGSGNQLPLFFGHFSQAEATTHNREPLPIVSHLSADWRIASLAEQRLQIATAADDTNDHDIVPFNAVENEVLADRKAAYPCPHIVPRTASAR